MLERSKVADLTAFDHSSGTVVLAQLMNLTHQALWDAAEPLLVGSPNHGRGRVVEHKMKSS